MPHPSSTRRTAGRTLLWLLLLVVVVAALWWFFMRDTDTPENTQGPGAMGGASAVSAIAAQKGDFPIILSALGTVRSLSSIEIRPRVEGELVSVDFQEGEAVEKGQVLAHIDDRTYQAQLAQANAELTQNQAQLATAREDLTRYENLGRANNVSRQDLETQRQLVRQYQGAVEAARASVQDAQVQLDYTTIEAPASGIIGLRNVDPGNIVSTGNDDPIATLTALDPISVIFSLPSQYLSQVRDNMQNARMNVEILEGNGMDTIATGELTSMDSAINTDTGTIRLRARINNENKTLYPNAFVNVELTLTTLEDVVIVPETAIQNGENGNYVYVVGEDNRVSQRPIEMTSSDDTRAVIASGLDAGERVVVDGVDRLRDGASVNVVSNQLPGETAADDAAADAARMPAGHNANEDSVEAAEASSGHSDQAP